MLSSKLKKRKQNVLMRIYKHDGISDTPDVFRI